MNGRQVNASLSGLAGGFPLVRGFDSVIQAIADQMDQGIVQALDHRLVHFGALAFGHQLDLLAGLPLQIMGEPAEPLEQGADRNHAQHHHGAAQFVGEILDLLADGAQAPAHTDGCAHADRRCPE